MATSPSRARWPMRQRSMDWSRSRTAATPACGRASSSTYASWAATNTTFTAKWTTADRDVAPKGVRVRSPGAPMGRSCTHVFDGCLRAERMGARPYCRYPFDGGRMSIRHASGTGRWPAWIGLGLTSLAGVAIAAGPVEPDGGASAAATELDRVVVTATRQADDALLVPADRKSTRLNSSHVKSS